MLSWDGPITPNSFFSSQEEQQDSGSNLANCASKAKQNHRLTYELRQPALQAQKEKTIFVEKGLFWMLTTLIFLFFFLHIFF